MRAVVVSDLHLTDRISDEYRWKVFEQIAEISNRLGVNDLLILGDLTEFKDYHSSLLVNKVVDFLYRLRKVSRIIQVRILKGNHDGVDTDTPYFKFLNRIPWCTFYTEPTWEEIGKHTYLYLPHTRNPEKDWKDVPLGEASHIFIHGTVTGAVSETGRSLEGIPLSMFRGLRSLILAGDIHVPQRVGKLVEYVGAPYPIRFGDEFSPRAIVLDGTKTSSEPLKNIRKATLRVTEDELPKKDLKGLGKGDRAKLVITLHESSLGDFHKIKKACAAQLEEIGVHLERVQLEKLQTVKPIPKPLLSKSTRTDKEEFDLFCTRNKVDRRTREIGTELIEGDSK